MVQIGYALEPDGDAALIFGQLLHSNDLSFCCKREHRLLLVQMYLDRVTHFGSGAAHHIGAMRIEIPGRDWALNLLPEAGKNGFSGKFHFQPGRESLLG